MKILISGFQRSGTTMTRRLFQYHPDIVKLLHEQKILWKKKTKQELIEYVKHFGIKDPINSNWGDKVPFYANKAKPQVKYIQRWNEVWGKEARTVYLVRHPVDIALSTVRVKMGPNTKVVIGRQNTSIPKTVELLHNTKRVIIVSFESLVTNPKVVLEKLFNFCNLNYSDKVIEKVSNAKRDQLRYFDSINADRAFAHKKEKKLKLGIEPYDYDKLRSLPYII